MPGIREICALFAAAGLGAGGTVGVQYVKPAISRTAATPKTPKKPAVRRVAAQQPRIAAAPAPAACIPALGGGANDIAALSPSIPGFTEPPHYSGTPAFLPSAFPVPGFDGPYHGTPGGTPGGGTPGGGVPGVPLPPGGPDPSRPTAVVPEVATWAMLVSGFGLLGLAMRRQKGGHGEETSGSPPQDV